MWPSQNAPNIQKQVRKLLKTQYGIRAANEEYYDTKKPRCKFMCDKDAPFERTLPQKVLQALVTPVSRYNLLARHDVGLGKSCAATSVAFNFAANGQNVLWVSRNQGLARETILKKLDCFEPLDGKQTMSNEFKADFLGKNSSTLWGNPKIGVQMLSFINLANLIKPVKSDTDRERLNALEMREPDIFRDCLLIIDEPHLMYTEGALGTEGRRSLWRDLGDAIDNSYKVSGENSVTILLLDATPIISDLDDAAKLINLLIRDPKKKLPLGDELLKELLNTPEKLGERMRGYISYAAGSNDITRFAQAEKYTVGSSVVMDNGNMSVKRGGKQKGGNARRVKLEYNYHEQLQVDCAQGSLQKRTTKPEKQKLLNCYFERGNYVGSVWLDKSWRDFTLVHNNPDTPVPQYKLDERAKLIEMCRNRAPKVYAIYDNIMRLDAEDAQNGQPKKKHYIFSGSAKTTSSVGVIAALFAAHDHQKLDFIDQPDRKLKWERSAGKKDAYIVMGKSATLYADKVKFRAGTFQALRDDIFSFINKRPDNTYGQEVRFIIFDYSLKEGVDLKDIGYIHMLEKQRTKAEETQALGRALRMCGNCALSYDKGWRIKTFTYDVIPDRLPLLAPDYVGEAKPKGDERADLGETWQEHVARYKDDVENEKEDLRSYSQSTMSSKAAISFAPYGDYVRQAATNDRTQMMFDRFDDLMHMYSIDYGLYDVYDKDKVRYAIAVDDNLDTLSDLVPVQSKKVREMRTMQNLLQEKMNRIHTTNLVPIVSPMAIAPDEYDFIIQLWAAPKQNYLSTKAKQDVVPSGRALQLFTNRCQYYLWLLAKGYNVLPYRCVKKLNRKLILKTMGVKEQKKVDVKKELDEAFAKPVFRVNASPINSAQNERNIIDRLKNRMDESFGKPKFRRNSAEALKERLDRSFGEAKFLEASERSEESERFLVAKPDSNNIYVRAHKIGQFDSQVTTAFDELFAQKEQVILQPYVDDARELSVWVVGAEQNEMKVIMTTDDELFNSGAEEEAKKKKKKKNKPIVTARDLCERLMRDMRDEVGKLWCVKFHLLQVYLDGEWVWHVDKITLRMDMRDWPKDEAFTHIDDYYNRLLYLTRPHNEP